MTSVIFNTCSCSLNSVFLRVLYACSPQLQIQFRAVEAPPRLLLRPIRDPNFPGRTFTSPQQYVIPPSPSSSRSDKRAAARDNARWGHRFLLAVTGLPAHRPALNTRSQLVLPSCAQRSERRGKAKKYAGILHSSALSSRCVCETTGDDQPTETPTCARNPCQPLLGNLTQLR